MGSNTERVIPSGLSVRAWYEKCEVAAGEFVLFVDLGFHVGEFGGEPDDDIEFDVRLSRVKVAVITSASVQVIQKSVNVDGSEPHATITRKISHDLNVNARGGVSINHGVEMNASAEGSIASNMTTETSTSSQIVEYAYEAQQHTWTITDAQSGKFLTGRPWVTTEAPRLKFRFVQNSDDCIKAVVTCHFQDIHIENVRQTGGSRHRGVAGKFRDFVLGPDTPQLAAAKQFLKRKLTEVNLEMQDHSGKAQTVLADIIVLED